MRHNISQFPPEQQLDFWLGDWEANWGEGQHGTKHIERAFAEHVIQEDFEGRPTLEFRGRSVSMYSPQIGQWQQTWALRWQIHYQRRNSSAV